MRGRSYLTLGSFDDPSALAMEIQYGIESRLPAAGSQHRYRHLPALFKKGAALFAKLLKKVTRG